ncbi:MAG: hypothetical protein RL095_736 [Verrucomicrobiota bacterium]|jgi:hypothetical protein
MNPSPLILSAVFFVVALWIYLRHRRRVWCNPALLICALGMIGASLWNLRINQSSEAVDFSDALSRRGEACGWILGDRFRSRGIKSVLILNQLPPAEAAAWLKGFKEALGPAGSVLVRELPVAARGELGLDPAEEKAFGLNPLADDTLLRFNTLSISRAAEASSAEALVLCGHGAPRIVDSASLGHLPFTALACLSTGDRLTQLRDLLPAGLLVCRPLPVLPQDQGESLGDIAARCFKLEEIQETP